jgi:hypothetical protein
VLRDYLRTFGVPEVILIEIPETQMSLDAESIIRERIAEAEEFLQPTTGSLFSDADIVDEPK